MDLEQLWERELSQLGAAGSNPAAAPINQSVGQLERRQVNLMIIYDALILFF